MIMIMHMGHITTYPMWSHIVVAATNIEHWTSTHNGHSIGSYTPTQRSWREVCWFHLVHLCVCGQNCVRSASSIILARSASYLHILSSNLSRCVACNLFFNIQFWNLGKFLKFVTFTLSCLIWVPIWINSMGGGYLWTQAQAQF